MILAPLALALALAPPATLDPPVRQAGGEAPEELERAASLEGWLRWARARRAVARAALEPEVAALVERLERWSQGTRTTPLEPLFDSIDALGPEAKAVLVPYLDPGEWAGDAALFRARRLAEHLRGVDDRAVTTALARMARSGSPVGREIAIELLGHSPSPARAEPVLRAILAEEQAAADAAESRTAGTAERDASREGSLRPALLLALARLDPASERARLEAALDDPDPHVVRAALRGLALGGSAPSAQRVGERLEGPKAAELAIGFLEFYESCPGAVDRALFGDLLRLAALPELDRAERLRLFDRLPEFEPGWSNEYGEILEPLASSTDRAVREGSLVCRARLGDRSARRQLLAPYDEYVREQRSYAPAYRDRGDVYMRLEEFDEAARDYKRAIDNVRDDPSIRRELHVRLARANVKRGRLPDAARAIEEGDLLTSQILELREDPDFADLVENPRYADLFRI